ncbi:MAG: thioredoxin family protein [Syntrophaceae bacterium]|nr:thioredoxin family protein [Syntrophaceae bacterium]
MLQTQLQHITSQEEAKDLIEKNPFVMICCGRMGPMCIPVYKIMHQLNAQYPHVMFLDADFDKREARFIRVLPECRTFKSLPFTIYYKNGQVAKATTGIQTKEQVVAILDEVFAPEGQTQPTFNAGEIETGYHPSGFRIDKTGAPLDRYTQWDIDANGRWHSARPVCFHSLPDQGWMKDETGNR